MLPSNPCPILIITTSRLVDIVRIIMNSIDVFSDKCIKVNLFCGTGNETSEGDEIAYSANGKLACSVG
jgi:hypothetical protein